MVWLSTDEQESKVQVQDAMLPVEIQSGDSSALRSLWLVPVHTATGGHLLFSLSILQIDVLQHFY